ncbi:uncharacterized protein [Salminus brasiliensis]|uniref:uncharacterized protein n=1 Tax=Salminus brasiliensis TaxID=930266 RepID=UPI003B83A0D0
MASTPSASALSAVLRCKRPPGSAYRLGLTYGAAQPISRAEKPDKPERRSPLWGFISPDAQLDTPAAKSVPVRLESAKGGGQRSRIQYVSNYPTVKYSGSCFTPKTRGEMAQAQTQPSRRMPGVDEDPLKADGRLRKKVSSRPLGDPLSVNTASFSEHGVVFSVYAGCKRDPSVSVMCRTISYHSFSKLRSRLLQFTTFLSDVVRSKLGAVWKKDPESNNQLTGCDRCSSKHVKKDKLKKGLEPGT